MMKLSCFTVAVLGICVTPVLGDLWPHVDGAMEHMFVTFDGTNLGVTLENPDHLPLPMLAYPGESYTSPADVLNGKGYSSQFGWSISGIWAPPTGTYIYAKVLDQTPGLETYQGGRRPVLQTHTYAPIFGTAGSPDFWGWPPPYMMCHNWYAASDFGSYEATYNVYLGDSNGVPNPAYGSANVTLGWTYTPEPSTLVLLGIVGLFMLHRR
jgi:hypothetical protein